MKYVTVDINGLVYGWWQEPVWDQAVGEDVAEWLNANEFDTAPELLDSIDPIGYEKARRAIFQYQDYQEFGVEKLLEILK